MTAKVKLVVYVPVSHSDAVRKALGDAGAGEIGNYSHCSFSIRGTGRFLGNDKARPAIGQAGILENVEEDRIEVTIAKDRLERVISAMKAVHPYDEVAFDIYPLINPNEDPDAP